MRGDSPVEWTGRAHLVTTSCEVCGATVEDVPESTAAEGVTCDVCRGESDVTMTVRFRLDGVADDRIFRDVVSLETGEYEHGAEATIRQRYEGEIDEIPVRGYEDVEICLEADR